MRSDTYRGSLMLAWWTAVLLGFTLAFQYGCGSSALQRHAQAVDGMAEMTNELTDQLEEQYGQAQYEALREACGTLDPDEAEQPCRNEARRRIDAVRATWRVVWAAHDAFRSAHDTYRRQVALAAREGSTLDHVQDAALQVARTYQALVETLAAAGARAPPSLPATLQRLTGGGS